MARKNFWKKFLEARKNLKEISPTNPKAAGRPLGVLQKYCPKRLDEKKQRVFTRYLNRHAFKTLEELEARLVESGVYALEALAIRTLLRAATKGEATVTDLVLNTARKGELKKPPEETPPAETPALPSEIPDDFPE